MSAATSRVYLDSVGVFGSGFANWDETQKILRGEVAYVETESTLPAPEWLPPAERRRTSDIIKLALCAGREALASAEVDIASTFTVFTSSGGSGEVIHQICESLATPEREVSPTRFHNSVHNAPAGYWGIATRSEWPSTSLCGHDASFAVGVMEALAQCHATAQPVLLLAHDLRYPEPLNTARTVRGLFSVAFLLRATKSARSIAVIDVALDNDGTAVTQMRNPALEQMRVQNPAARALPLLHAIGMLNRAVTHSATVESVNGQTLHFTVSSI
jgi:hypothetical protein